MMWFCYFYIEYVGVLVVIMLVCECVIEVCSVIKCYGKVIVFDNIDLDVFCGEVFFIVGGLGSGKMMLLCQVVGLEKFILGMIYIFGEELIC